MPVSGKDPYFLSDEKSLDGEFKGFKKYGTFTSSEVMGPFIAEAISNLDPSRVNTFEKTISDLLEQFTKHPSAYEDFLGLMDDLRVEGIVLMALRKGPFREYHTSEHAEELVYDLVQELTKIYERKFPRESIANSFFLELAKVAGAWHDVVQDLVPPYNEAESAKQFSDSMQKRMQKLSIAHPVMQSQIEHYIQQIKFISNELIVNATWLVLGVDTKKQAVRKNFYQYVYIALEDYNFLNRKMGMPEIVLGTGNYLDRLLLAAVTIGLADTSRFLLDHVLQEQMILKVFDKLPAHLKKPWEDFFNLYHITSAQEKEMFLGQECQDFRMFPELNFPQDAKMATEQPPFNLSHISEDDFEYFINVCDNNRLSKQVDYKIDYAHLLNMFINTKSKNKNSGIEKRNIEREESFARSLQKEEWDRHADILQKFDEYVLTLDNEARNILGEVIVVLSTRFQPGFIMLQNDKKFQQKLKEALEKSQG
ncbi:MAG: hypothetical protein P4M12_09290 [Gammaproteobacteria bacterium]|nr:hypothetical protein [Gammaproteobacteria bacterium]